MIRIIGMLVICAAGLWAQSTKSAADDMIREAMKAVKARDLKQAEFWFREARREYPQNQAGAYGLMGILEEEERFQDALRTGREVQPLMEKIAAYHVSMGRLLSKTDQVPEAITEFQAAMRYDSSRDMQASMYGMIGDAQRRLGRPDESITSFRKAKEISGRASVLLAMMLGSRGDHDEALAEYREAVRQTPNLPGVLNSFAYAMAEWDENLDEALPAARRAVEMMPSSAEFVDTLGWVLFKKGMLLDAEYAFFDGLRLEGGNDPTLRSHLAAGMDARGDWSGDRRELRTLLEGELSARQLARMKELLRK